MKKLEHTFSAKQSGLNIGPCNRKGILPSYSPTARDAVPHPALPGATLPRWQRERARRLHRLFLRLEARIASGLNQRRALKWIGWFYNSKPRFYRCERSRQVRFSKATIKREFYRWRNGGRIADALALRYRPGRERLPASEVQTFARLCLAPMVCSMRGAYQILPRPAGTCSAFRHSLSRSFLAAAVKMFAARRAALRIERAARRELERFQAK